MLEKPSRLLLHFSVAALIAVLSGCATLPADAPSYSRAPLAPQGYATVYFYRVGAYPTLRTPNVFIADVKVFEPPERAYTWVYVKAGDQPFRIEWSWDTKWPALAFTKSVAAGESYYIKISGSHQHNGRTSTLGSRAQLIPWSDAERELDSCCKLLKPAVRDIP